MTIEERLVRDHGTTRNPVLGVWLTTDGTLVNGSYEGRQRDVDHHEINAYFKTSKYEDPGSSAVYIRKFMRRGNIHWGCGDGGFCADIARTPTLEQFKVLVRHMTFAMENGIQTCIGRRRRNGETEYCSFPQYLAHLGRYTDLLERHPVYVC